MNEKYLHFRQKYFALARHVAIFQENPKHSNKSWDDSDRKMRWDSHRLRSFTLVGDNYNTEMIIIDHSLLFVRRVFAVKSVQANCRAKSKRPNEMFINKFEREKHYLF